MPGEADYEPFDSSPASQSQIGYLTQLLGQLGRYDWSKLDTTRASESIDKLNAVRRMAGIPFVPFDGMDVSRIS